jgi:hypothetical protein
VKYNSAALCSARKAAVDLYYLNTGLKTGMPYYAGARALATGAAALGYGPRSTAVAPVMQLLAEPTGVTVNPSKDALGRARSDKLTTHLVAPAIESSLGIFAVAGDNAAVIKQYLWQAPTSLDFSAPVIEYTATALADCGAPSGCTSPVGTAVRTITGYADNAMLSAELSEYYITFAGLEGSVTLLSTSTNGSCAAFSRSQVITVATEHNSSSSSSLNHGTPYYMRVAAAKHGTVIGPFTVATTVTGPAHGSPGAPLNATVTADTATVGTVYVAWIAVDSDNTGVCSVPDSSYADGQSSAAATTSDELNILDESKILRQQCAALQVSNLFKRSFEWYHLRRIASTRSVAYACYVFTTCSCLATACIHYARNLLL